MRVHWEHLKSRSHLYDLWKCTPKWKYSRVDTKFCHQLHQKRMTASGTVTGKNSVIVTTFSFQWIHLSRRPFVFSGRLFHVSNHHHQWNGKVVSVTTLIFTDDVEDKLQRLQWIPRLSTWRSFRFCVHILSHILSQRWRFISSPAHCTALHIDCMIWNISQIVVKVETKYCITNLFLFIPKTTINVVIYNIYSNVTSTLTHADITFYCKIPRWQLCEVYCGLYSLTCVCPEI